MSNLCSKIEATSLELLYILKLEDEKYYIGKTCHLNETYRLHMCGKAGDWTAKYKPISINAVRLIKDEFDLANTVKKFMMSYGMDSVRGGPYSQTVLSDDTKMLLTYELNGSSLMEQMVVICYRCGRVGHKSSECYAEYHAEGYRLGES